MITMNPCSTVCQQASGSASSGGSCSPLPPAGALTRGPVRSWPHLQFADPLAKLPQQTILLMPSQVSYYTQC